MAFIAPTDTIYGTIINRSETDNDSISAYDINLIPVSEVEREDLVFMEVWKEKVADKKEIERLIP